MGNIDQDKIRIEPLKNSINPGFLISFPYEYSDSREVFLSISGELYANQAQKERIRIANLYSSIDNQTNSTRKIVINTQNTWDTNSNLSLTAELSPKAIEYLENLRTQNKKGDISLRLNIIITSINQFTIENGNPALSIRDYAHNSNITIKHSDWIHDFCPVFGIGNFFLFEYIMPEGIKGSTELVERLNGTMQSLESMKKHITNGEWQQAINESRGIAELLRKNAIKDEIKNLVVQDGGTEEAAKHLTDSIDNLFNYASKFHHKTQNGKITTDMKPSKEDAYLIYTLSVNLVSLVSAKLNRLS